MGSRLGRGLAVGHSMNRAHAVHIKRCVCLYLIKSLCCAPVYLWPRWILDMSNGFNEIVSAECRDVRSLEQHEQMVWVELCIPAARMKSFHLILSDEAMPRADVDWPTATTACYLTLHLQGSKIPGIASVPSHNMTIQTLEEWIWRWIMSMRCYCD